MFHFTSHLSIAYLQFATILWMWVHLYFSKSIFRPSESRRFSSSLFQQCLLPAAERSGNHNLLNLQIIINPKSSLALHIQLGSIWFNPLATSWPTPFFVPVCVYPIVVASSSTSWADNCCICSENDKVAYLLCDKNNCWLVKRRNQRFTKWCVVVAALTHNGTKPLHWDEHPKTLYTALPKNPQLLFSPDLHMSYLCSPGCKYPWLLWTPQVWEESILLFVRCSLYLLRGSICARRVHAMPCRNPGVGVVFVKGLETLMMPSVVMVVFEDAVVRSTCKVQWMM